MAASGHGPSNVATKARMAATSGSPSAGSAIAAARRTALIAGPRPPRARCHFLRAEFVGETAPTELLRCRRGIALGGIHAEHLGHDTVENRPTHGVTGPLLGAHDMASKRSHACWILSASARISDTFPASMM